MATAKKAPAKKAVAKKAAPAKKAPAAKKAAPAKLEKVKLLKKHTHQGIEHAAGAEIEVNERDKAWLLAQDIIASPDSKETK